MVKNGFNSVPAKWAISATFNSLWKSQTNAETKSGIKTIFDQFRNSHARLFVSLIGMETEKGEAVILYALRFTRR
jgi:hypothetical protein